MKHNRKNGLARAAAAVLLLAFALSLAGFRPACGKKDSPFDARFWLEVDREFRYSGGKKTFWLKFDEKNGELLYAGSLADGKIGFYYEFLYDVDGRIEKITRFDAEGNALVTRAFSFEDDPYPCYKLIVGQKESNNPLVKDHSWTDQVYGKGGPHYESSVWGLADGEQWGYTLSVWDESREPATHETADRVIFQITFSTDGTAEAYTLFWGNEIAEETGFSAFRQTADERHVRVNLGWIHDRSTLRLYDRKGNCTATYQRWGDSHEWQ